MINLIALRALADAATLHVEPWADDGDGNYQCAKCQRDMWLRSSEYEPRGLCEECIDTALTDARSAVPALLNRVEALEAGVAPGPLRGEALMNRCAMCGNVACQCPKPQGTQRDGAHVAVGSARRPLSPDAEFGIAEANTVIAHQVEQLAEARAALEIVCTMLAESIEREVLFGAHDVDPSDAALRQRKWARIAELKAKGGVSHDDLILIARLSKAVNRTAYHGGLGLEESGKYIGVLDRILEAHGTDVDKLVLTTVVP